jgi:hypothetical protein
MNNIIFISILVIICVDVQQHAVCGKFEDISYGNINLKHSHYPPTFNLTHSTERALSLLGDRATEIPTSVAVMYLYSFGFGHKRDTYLHCSLSMLAVNIAPTTSLHIYLFVPPSFIEFIPDWLTLHFPYVCVMPIDADSWTIPQGLNYNYFVGNEIHRVDYFLMGRWRLQFQPAFTSSLGYPYMLQIDDDTYVASPLAFNIVDHFNQHDIAWGIRNYKEQVYYAVVWGLPEFTRYVIVYTVLLVLS